MPVLKGRSASPTLESPNIFNVDECEILLELGKHKKHREQAVEFTRIHWPTALASATRKSLSRFLLMPRQRKLQFSLLALFVLITFCAVLLAIWINQPAQVVFQGANGHALQGSPTGSGVYCTRYRGLASPRGREIEYYEVVVLLPPGQQASVEGDYYLPSCEMKLIVSNEDETDSREANIKISCLEAHELIVVGNESAKLKTGAVYLVQLDNELQTHLSLLENADFSALDCDTETRAELEEYHREFLELRDAGFPPADSPRQDSVFDTVSDGGTP